MILPNNIIAWNWVKEMIGNESYFIWYVKFGLETCESMLSLSSCCCLKIRIKEKNERVSFAIKTVH